MAKTLLEQYGLPPAAIEALSLSRVEQVVGELGPSDPRARTILLRMVYACGDPALAPFVHISPGAVAAGLDAIRAGRPIVVDVRMVEVAIDRHRAARLGLRIACAIDDPAVVRAAQVQRRPRAAVAIERLAPDAAGSIVVIGNAPTALLALLDLIDAGREQPALIIGTPVGFVAARESKEELMRRAVPYITVTGTRGGSPIAAAAMNALLRLVEQDGA